MNTTHGRPAIIVDIDGTIAHRVTDRSPYDWHRVGEDELDKTLWVLINHLQRDCHGWTPVITILLSGRDSCCREETEKWLAGKEVEYDLLFMREEKDNRKDAIIKQELYEKHIKDKYDILFVLDDRDQVVEMWRSLGLKCLQVASGKF